MFNTKLRKEVKELKELVSLLDWELRWMIYEREQAKNPEKKLCPPIPKFQDFDALSIDDLRKKYRGSISCKY